MQSQIKPHCGCFLDYDVKKKKLKCYLFLIYWNQLISILQLEELKFHQLTLFLLILNEYLGPKQVKHTYKYLGKCISN